MMLLLLLRRRGLLLGLLDLLRRWLGRRHLLEHLLLLHLGLHRWGGAGLLLLVGLLVDLLL